MSCPDYERSQSYLTMHDSTDVSPVQPDATGAVDTGVVGVPDNSTSPATGELPAFEGAASTLAGSFALAGVLALGAVFFA